MGNVNGREDGSNTLSAVEDDDAENSSREAMAVSDGTHVSMGHSPPHSPRATQSPLMFAPQVPVLPLQRPDEIHIPNPSWMQPASSIYEESCNEQGIPTMITWCHGGKEIAVEGSWDNWKTRIHLQRSGKDFTIMKVLPSGVYEYRFIVDGQCRHAPELPSARDDAGNTYNILDLQEYVPEDIESISGFEPPESPESSYKNLLLGGEDYAKEPPVVPPHLQMTVLNLQAPPLPRPQHVILNHIYMQKGRSGPSSVVALASTHRFLSKYVTVVLYKSLPR
ncbi:PREDICTED: SNF1-related protein kinase regulatory subunit beta-2 [Tarenaya hassleriana]|uniref:SNF1-related protein kinase regulatory subunit beta-2 n=1 Tax=Tarenaya hassleriana TaxID=28532 RepID=UPI00053C9EFB|nr:PREDICTED: SNF1-related protein kinase regulatory subunit beta-2 [Tarenaya hassleriana]XP_010540835.1 PREDICTED: SNF1-related protein kinase regulatory subunit beta-2 [Tarenaya hassleriana]